MRLFTRVAPGEYELNFMWLPTWVVLNATLMSELERELAAVFPPGTPVTDAVLANAEEVFYGFIQSRFPAIKGFRDYVDGLKFVEVTEG